MPPAQRILGIESSCDETAAAIVVDASAVLSSIVSSQDTIHRKYGGVVPELASREHLRQIVPVVREALEQAGLALGDMDAIAVTRGPGLIGSLLVGLTYGKVLAGALGKPLIAVNHLEGHIHAVLLQARGASRQPQFPAVCLVVSGGHTILCQVNSVPGVPSPVREAGENFAGVQGPSSPAAVRLSYAHIGGTRDDAAGEAYDKVAKMLALGYPGGPIIDELAKRRAEASGGAQPPMLFGEPKMKGNPFDFSFSGLKTAVLYYLRRNTDLAGEIAERQAALERGERSVETLQRLCTRKTLDLLAAFQSAAVGDLVTRTLAAAEQFAARSVLVSGGVAANRELRERFQAESKRRRLEVYFPSRALSTDNAAMIAAAAYPKLLAGETAGPFLNAEANLPLV